MPKHFRNIRNIRNSSTKHICISLYINFYNSYFTYFVYFVFCIFIFFHFSTFTFWAYFLEPILAMVTRPVQGPPPFRTRTDISRWLVTINKTFPVDCASLQLHKSNLNQQMFGVAGKVHLLFQFLFGKPHIYIIVCWRRVSERMTVSLWLERPMTRNH